MTEQIHQRDAEQMTCEATVVAVAGGGEEAPRVLLDRTVMYPTGGGQPHDLGHIGERRVVGVFRDPGEHDDIWHVLGADTGTPEVGEVVTVEVDRDRRRALMRTHTAMHILCGVMWRDHGVVVTGGNMEPLSGRLDFEFRNPPEGFREDLEAALNREVGADRAVSVEFLDRDVALADDSLIRTKVNLVPESVTEIRVVEIEGLDRQADGGTHVASTSEVGGLRVSKVQSKGKGFRRIRLEVLDAPPSADDP